MIRPSGRHVIDAEDEPERSRRPHSGRHDPGDDGPGGDECAGKPAEAPPTRVALPLVARRIRTSSVSPVVEGG